MPLYVVAVPELAAKDRGWIQTIRSRHDPLHAIIDPHFTLVFAIDDQTAEIVWRHAEPILRASAPIDFILCHATPQIDGRQASPYVFLIADRGGDALRDLHARLHSGPLARYLDPARSFVPHITVARMKGIGAARALVADLERDGIQIQGRISSAALVEFDNSGLRILTQRALGEHQTSPSPK